MKVPVLLFVLLFLSLWKVSATQEPPDVTVFDLPDFSMQLLIEKPHVDPKPFQWPLVATTSIHLSSYMKAILEANNRDASSLKISLNPSLAIDEDISNAFPGGTIIRANFEGEVYLDSDNNGMGQYISQTVVDAMVNQAFKGSPFHELKDNFSNDSTLKQISDVKVWVTLPTNEGVNEVQIDTARGTQPEENASEARSNKPLKIAAATCVVSMVMIGSVSLYAYLRHRKRTREDGDTHSKESDSTSHSSEAAEDPSVFSTEYWKEAWAQAASQVKPRPPRRERQFKRKPSSVRPNLDSIVEGEEEEEWDESSWSGGNPLDSYATWMAPADVEDSSAIAPAVLEVEMDTEADMSPQSSEGSFFKDEDPEIEIVVDMKPSLRPFRRNKERDVENQVKPKVKKAARSTPKHRESDEITDVRNRVLSKKKEKVEAKSSVADEIALVRNRVLSKEKQEKKEEPPKEVNELAMVHQRILSKKEAAKSEEPVVTDELTMMRNRILSKSQHSKAEGDRII